MVTWGLFFLWILSPCKHGKWLISYLRHAPPICTWSGTERFVIIHPGKGHFSVSITALEWCLSLQWCWIAYFCVQIQNTKTEDTAEPLHNLKSNLLQLVHQFCTEQLRSHCMFNWFDSFGVWRFNTMSVHQLWGLKLLWVTIMSQWVQKTYKLIEVQNNITRGHTHLILSSHRIFSGVAFFKNLLISIKHFLSELPALKRHNF